MPTIANSTANERNIVGYGGRPIALLYFKTAPAAGEATKRPKSHMAKIKTVARPRFSVGNVLLPAATTAGNRRACELPNPMAGRINCHSL